MSETNQADDPARHNRVRLGSTEFNWPVPDRSVDVAGRRVSIEVLVVAALHMLAGLWLLFEVRSLVTGLPDILGGLFSDAFSFLISYLFLIITAFVGYVIAGLVGTGALLFLSDPVGRGLSAVMSVSLVLLFLNEPDGVLAVITFISLTCTAVLILSPWARGALAEGARRRQRPSVVVLAQTLALTLFSMTGLVGVLLLPGIRFADVVGTKFVFFELFALGAAGVGAYGVLRLIA